MRQVFFILIICIEASQLGAQIFDYNCLTYRVLDSTNKTCEVYNNQSVTGELTITPIAETADSKYKVISIADSAFYFSEISCVSLPASISNIGKNAFAGCFGLIKAQFASIESLCSIEFGNCHSNPEYYAHTFFIDDEEITNIAIPESLSSIGRYAFAGCANIKHLILPESLTSIGDGAFYYCSNLTSVTIPKSINLSSGKKIEKKDMLLKFKRGYEVHSLSMNDREQ